MTFDEIDALESITCEVTQDDIDNGQLGFWSASPIAFAVCRTLGLHRKSAIVGPRCPEEGEITVYPGPARFLCNTFSHTPESAQFTDDFDNGKKVEPATFILKRWPK